MKNPWLAIPERAPYVLGDDLPYILTHNGKVADAFGYQTSMLPEPFIGNPRAPIVLLNLNPGFAGEADLAIHKNNRMFRTLLTNNLKQKRSPFPFFYLNPSLADIPGHGWWNMRLRTLIEQFGVKAISEAVFCLEFFPYHSRQFKISSPIPSQKYNFFLLDEAMKRKATIIVFRSYKLWCGVVPRLSGYKHVYQLNSSQSVYLTERNCPEGFASVVKLLEAKRT